MAMSTGRKLKKKGISKSRKEEAVAGRNDADETSSTGSTSPDRDRNAGHKVGKQGSSTSLGVRFAASPERNGGDRNGGDELKRSSSVVIDNKQSTKTTGLFATRNATAGDAVDTLSRTANQQLLNQLLLAGQADATETSTAGSTLSEAQRHHWLVDSTGYHDINDSSGSPQVASQRPPHRLSSQSTPRENALEEQLGPVIKTLYTNGKQDAFMKQLDFFIKEKEGEIERLCNFHYQDFVSSVDHLLQFRNDTQALRNKIVEYNKDLQDATQTILSERQEFAQLTMLSSNLKSTATLLKECWQTMQIVQKMKKLTQGRKFYQAVRVLEDLELVFLPPLQHLQFANYIKSCIPSFRMQIRSAVSQEMTDWFVSVRSKTPRIGRLVLEYTSRMLAPELAKIRTVRTGSIVTIAAPLLEQASRQTSQSSLQEGEELSLDHLDVCDSTVTELYFRPLYQGLHIFETLNVRSEFLENFERNRKAQANLVLSPSFPLHSAAADLVKLEGFLHEVAGFFVVEYIVCKTTENFRSKVVVDALWDSAIEKLLTQLQNGLKGCNDVGFYTTIKALLIGFMHCMEYYHYSGHRLMELLITLSAKYAELVTLHATASCLRSVVENDSAPITITSDDEATRLRKLCPWVVTKENTAKLPASFVFSHMVTEIMMAIKDLIRGVQHFTAGFSTYHTETDELLRSTLDTLFIKTILPAMSKRSNSASLSQIARLVIDIIHLTDGLDVIEGWIGGQSSSSASASGGGHIKTRKIVLGQTRQAITEQSQAAEKRVFVLCNEKINGFIDCAEYNYEPTELQKGPSPFLVDLVDFLRTVWDITLVDLPLHVKSFVYYESIFHVCEVLMKLFVGPQIKRISPLFFINFNLDLMFLEQFVASLNQPNLEDLLVELRQLETLCTSDVPEEFMDKEIRMRKYSRLEKRDVVAILEKMKELSVLGTLADAFTQMPGTQILSMGAVSQKQLQKSEQAKVKRKSLEQMIKTLRGEMEHEKPSSRGRG